MPPLAYTVLSGAVASPQASGSILLLLEAYANLNAGQLMHIHAGLSTP
jgi:hypothetical protein